MTVKRKILSIIAFSMIFNNTVMAGEVMTNAIINGSTSSFRPNPVYNINPYNISTYAGVGESGILKLFSKNQIIELPINSPLYKINEGYKDRIVNKNGVWGIERNVGVYEFTGAENWEVYSKNSYKNDNTVAFICDSPIDTNILNGMCTHFDVLSDKEQKTSIYDALSFSTDGSKIIMRFMNVRNIKTVENIKNFLYSQNITGSSVKLFYFLNTPTFEVFDDDIQLKLNDAFYSDNINSLGFSDKNLKSIDFSDSVSLNTNVFNSNTLENEKLDRFFTGVTDLKIYNSGNERYFINGINLSNTGIEISIKDSDNIVYKGIIEYYNSNFINDKNTEIILRSDSKDTVIRMLINLSKVKIPLENIYTNSSEPLKESCKSQIETVVPDKVYYTRSGNTEIYLSNTVISGGSTANSEFKVTANNYSYIFDKNKIIPIVEEENLVINYTLKGEKNSPIEFEYVPNKEINRELNIMFLGDSLINQDYYSKYVKEMFQADGTNINLIGTRGIEDNRHEGRGGWSAYNYCNSLSYAGYTNSFLNNGKFDFKYYIESNNLETPDYIVLNLGINDLNLDGHNSYDEIFTNFDTIINSIHEYNSNIYIVINTPVLLYETNDTVTAKNQRLAFTKELMNKYKEGENIIICPSYLALNPRTDYKLLEQELNEDNQNTTLIVTDTTHPNIFGYENMANMTYTYIRYIETILK